MSSEKNEPVPHAAVVYQPFKTDVDALRIAVSIAETDAGWGPTRWYETEEADAGTGAARRAVDEGAAVVIGAGGDGTIRALAEGMRGTEVPLTIVPQGTGNLLARNLGAPLDDMQNVVRAAFQGVDRPIDLGLLTIVRPDESEEEHVFLVLAGMGLDARTISITNPDLKKKVGWLAYVDAGVRTMVKEKPLEVHYSLDQGAVKSLRVFTVMIGNCGLLPGGVHLIPDAKLDDGMLDVIVMKPLGPFSWLSIWRKIGLENGVLSKSRFGRRIIDLGRGRRAVTYSLARKYALSVPHPEPVQLDGDDFGLAVQVSGSVDPRSLVLRVDPAWVAEG